MPQSPVAPRQQWPGLRGCQGRRGGERGGRALYGLPPRPASRASMSLSIAEALTRLRSALVARRMRFSICVQPYAHFKSGGVALGRQAGTWRQGGCARVAASHAKAVVQLGLGRVALAEELACREIVVAGHQGAHLLRDSAREGGRRAWTAWEFACGSSDRSLRPNCTTVVAPGAAPTQRDSRGGKAGGR